MRKVFVVLFLAYLYCFFGSCVFGMEAVSVENLKPGFVYFGPVGDGGWTFMHDKGRREMEKAFPGMGEVDAIEESL